MNDPTIRDELRDLILVYMPGADGIADSATIADEILSSPMILRIQAEAWDDGFDAHDQDWKHHDANNWGDEDCIDATHNPYREIEGGSNA